MNCSEKIYLSWRDIAEMFDYGRSKALLLMHEVGVTHVGHTVFVRIKDLEDHIERPVA